MSEARSNYGSDSSFAEFDSDTVELLSKYVRKRDESGKLVKNFAGDQRSSELIGPKGAYVVDDTRIDEQARVKAGDYFDELLNTDVKITGPGENVPLLRTFDEMGLCDELKMNLLRRGYNRPLPVQQAAFSLISHGFDLIAHAQTGSGKTHAFLIPIVNTILKERRTRTMSFNRSNPYCIIISPAKELAEQIAKEAKELTHGTCCDVVLSFGGMRRSDDEFRIKKGCDIAILTVGRLCDFVQNGVLNLDNLKFLVFDEADKLLDDTQGFSEEIRNDIVTKLPHEGVCKLCFSATDLSQLEDFAMDILRCTPTKVVVGHMNAVSATIDQQVIESSEFDKHSILLDLLEQRRTAKGLPKTLIFVNTRRKCTVISAFLCMNDFKAYPVHGNLTTTLRRKNVVALMKDECDILVATDVLARGIDINISLVINYDLPRWECWASYVHRVGRTGRLGNKGYAITFYSADSDSAMSLLLCQQLEITKQQLPEFLEKDAIDLARMEDWHQKAIEEYSKAMASSDQGERPVDDDDDSSDGDDL